MGMADRIVNGVVSAVSMVMSAGDVSNLSPRTPLEQASSHYEQRADDRSRRRTRTVQSSTRNAGNRRRGSGQGNKKNHGGDGIAWYNRG